MRSYRRALVTGATSGIGAAFAQELPVRTDLLLTGRDLERLSRAAERLARPGRTIETHAADLTDAGARDRLAELAEAFGVDLLINNASTGRVGRFLDNPAGRGARDGAPERRCCGRPHPPSAARHVAASARRRAGLIIVSSTAAFAPVPFFAAYAASKVFDLHFAEALAEELRGEPVDVLALCPGATRTGFRRGFELGKLPGASEPRDVAAEGLAALGRDTVRVVGRLNQAALGPFVLPRRLMTEAIGLAMRFVAARGD